MDSSRKDVYIPIVLAVMVAYSRPVPLDDIVDKVMELLRSLRDQMEFEGATGDCYRARNISGTRK